MDKESADPDGRSSYEEIGQITVMKAQTSERTRKGGRRATTHQELRKWQNSWTLSRLQLTLVISILMMISGTGFEKSLRHGTSGLSLRMRTAVQKIMSGIQGRIKYYVL